MNLKNTKHFKFGKFWLVFLGERGLRVFCKQSPKL